MTNGNGKTATDFSENQSEAIEATDMPLEQALFVFGHSMFDCLQSHVAPPKLTTPCLIESSEPPAATRQTLSTFMAETSTESSEFSAGNSEDMDTNTELEWSSIQKLPTRLFAAGCYPTGARLNIYSKANIIGLLIQALAGTDELETLRNSQFGKLFSLPVARCHNSAKLVHALVSRQLVTQKKHEIWFLFGNKPLRFSLREFHRITGLKCVRFPLVGTPEGTNSPEISSTMWSQLFHSDQKEVTVMDAIEMLKDPNLPEWKRLRLALIILVDGVILCGNKHLKLTPSYVEMLSDLEYFNEYPWGRESFSKTLSRFQAPQPGPEIDDPINELRQRCRQQTSACYGFPLPLQLMAFESIPLLLNKIPEPQNTSTFLEDPTGCQTVSTILYEEDITEVEYHPQLTVQPIVDIDTNDPDMGWDDEVDDAEVSYLQKLINEGHPFGPSDFPGGDTSIHPI